MFVPRWRRPEPLESLAEPAAEDLAGLAELRALGSNPALPHPVRAFAGLPDREAAERASARLERLGYRCRHWFAAGRWRVSATRWLRPTPGAVTRVHEQVREVAAAEGGEWLGWEASPVR